MSDILSSSPGVSTAPSLSEIAAKVAVWRQKELDGTLTLEEMREAVLILRQGRFASAEAAAKSGKSKSKSKEPPKTGADLLRELDL